MPQLERWNNLPEGVRQHLIERMRELEISVKSAAADRTPKRSYSDDEPPTAKASEHRPLGDYSGLVTKGE